ncbi:MAG: hypothetical protein L3J52_09220 [Proteobacteria bacterium]|nr:hypothetical protein [Pseudomonadota bacterium]
MSVDSICKSLLNDVPKALAAGVVDMETGMLLGVKTTDSHPTDIMDMLAAGTKELFEGDMSMMIDKVFKKSRGDKSEEPYFKEIIINSKNLIHLFIRLPSSPNVVATVVCRIDANLGLVVTKGRSITRNDTI